MEPPTTHVCHTRPRSLPPPPRIAIVMTRILAHPRLSMAIAAALAILYHYAYLTAFLHYNLFILGTYSLIVLVYPWLQRSTLVHRIGSFPPPSFIQPSHLNAALNTAACSKAVPTDPHASTTTTSPSDRKVKRALDRISSLVVRDFVQSWYAKTSPDPAFPLRIETVLRQAAHKIYLRCSTVDWDAFLTRRVMPLVTQHVADYRIATEMLMMGGKKNIVVSDVGASIEADCQLARYFRGGNLHPAINTNPAPTIPSELNYLRKVVDAILPSLFAPGEVHSRLFAVLLREIIACRIIQPILDSISDSDYWMQNIQVMADKIIQEQNLHNKIQESDERLHGTDPSESHSAQPHYEIDYPPTFDGFMKKIKKCNDLSEALQIRDALVTDIRTRSKETEGMALDDLVHGILVRERRTYINQLTQALARLEKRIEALGGSTKKVSDADPESAARARPSLFNLLEEPYLSYFMEHMDQEGRVQYLRFWLSVDGLRFHLKANTTTHGLDITDWRTLFDDVRQVYNTYLADQAPAKIDLSNPALVKQVEVLIADLDERANQALQGAQLSTPPMILAPIFKAQSDVWSIMEAHDHPSFLTSQRYIKFSNQVSQMSPLRSHKMRNMLHVKWSHGDNKPGRSLSSSLDLLSGPYRRPPTPELRHGRSTSSSDTLSFNASPDGPYISSPLTNAYNNNNNNLSSPDFSIPDISSSPHPADRLSNDGVLRATEIQMRWNSHDSADPSLAARDPRLKKKRSIMEFKQALKNSVVSSLKPMAVRQRMTSPTRGDSDIEDTETPVVVNRHQQADIEEERRTPTYSRRDPSDKVVTSRYPEYLSDQSSPTTSNTPTTPTAPAIVVVNGNVAANELSDRSDDDDGRQGAFSQFRRKGREAARQLSPSNIFRRSTTTSYKFSSSQTPRAKADSVTAQDTVIHEEVDVEAESSQFQALGLAPRNDNSSGSIAPSPSFLQPPRSVVILSTDMALSEGALTGTLSDYEDDGVPGHDSNHHIDRIHHNHDGSGATDDSDQEDLDGGESGNEEDLESDDNDGLTDYTRQEQQDSCGNAETLHHWNGDSGGSELPPFTTVVDGFDLPPIIPPPPHAVELSVKIAQLMIELAEVQTKIRAAEESGQERQTIRDMRDWEGFLKSQEAAARVAMRDLEAKELENFLIPGRIFVSITDVLRRDVNARDRPGKPYAYQFQVHRRPADRDESGWMLERTHDDFNKLHQSLRSRFPTLMGSLKPPRVSERRHDGRSVTHRESIDDIARLKLKVYLETLLRFPELCRSSELRNFMASESISGCLLALASNDVKSRRAKFSPIYKRPFPFMFQPRIDDPVSENGGSFTQSDSLYSHSQLNPTKIDRNDANGTVKSDLSATIKTDGYSPPPPLGLVPSPAVLPPHYGQTHGRRGSMSESVVIDSDRGVTQQGGDVVEHTKAMAAVMDLLSELFELRDRSNWFRRQAIGIAIQTIFSKNLEKRMSDALAWALSDDSLSHHLDVLVNSLWPGGVWWAWANTTPTMTSSNLNKIDNYPSSSTRTKEQRAKTQYIAEVKLQRLLPELVGAVVGRTNAKKGALRLCRTFQNGRLDRELAYRLLDAFIEGVFPDVVAAAQPASVATLSAHSLQTSNSRG
ncbi:hypothetical protein SeMB42_g06850 [Synchytrium endobioticum]|uniref:PX domain-containing protein n=1 Tax=Synchytrium endobioticum TaxID=286115 RepID=A0A507CDY8_9FUNG|nr:hypothetical protein SeMB42_g06850 [Synchytrium endobioticum]